MRQKETEDMERRLANALIGFVERAAKEGAAPEEVQVLPQAADVLNGLLNPR